MYDGIEEIEVYPDEQLHNLLPRAEVLLIALPLTQETKNLIDKNEINLMPKGSILINVGRGPIVNQYALYDALVEGHLRAAGSDVWYNYPKSKEERVNTPPANLPFGKLENFVLSPHRGGMVEEVEQQRAEALAKLLNSANRGEEIPNKVDLSSGY
jgi:phosphoglycerate dehydrogenase-like enzyme